MARILTVQTNDACYALTSHLGRDQRSLTDRNSHAGWFARCSDTTQGYAGVRGVAARGSTRYAHNSPARQDLNVYECTFYRRDSDKEDAELTRVCTIRAARESIFNEAAPTRAPARAGG
jgi:hypothetical protein